MRFIIHNSLNPLFIKRDCGSPKLTTEPPRIRAHGEAVPRERSARWARRTDVAQQVYRNKPACLFARLNATGRASEPQTAAVKRRCVLHTVGRGTLITFDSREHPENYTVSRPRLVSQVETRVCNGLQIRLSRSRVARSRFSRNCTRSSSVQRIRKTKNEKKIKKKFKKKS